MALESAGPNKTGIGIFASRISRSKTYAVLGALALGLQSWAQALPNAIYVESFRKGPTRISEQAIVANLNSENATYRTTIKDSAGNDRFQLSFEPEREGVQHRIVSWRVLLIDPHRGFLGNYLVATKPPEPLSDRPQDRAWWLDPSPYAVVPLLARRMFKVEDFYCVIQVKDYHLLVPERHLLDSMRVELQFTESDPRNGKAEND